MVEEKDGRGTAGRAFRIGEAIRARREELRLPQVVVAERAGMTQSALSRLETGRAGIPTITLLERLAAALDADLIVSLAPRASHPH